MTAVIAWIERLVEAQRRRPLLWLALALVSVVLAGALASRLTLRPHLRALLPEDRRSIEVAQAVEARLPTGSVLAVVSQAPRGQLAARQDAIAAALEQANLPDVGAIDRGPDAEAFFAEHGWLYLPLADLERAATRAKERYDREVHRRTGALLDEPEAEPWEEALSMEEPAEAPGRYLDEERGLAVVLVHTAVGPGDLERRPRLIEGVRRAVAPVAPVELAGNLVTGAEAYDRIRADLSHVGILGVALVLGVVLLFFLRFRAVIALLVAVGVGTAWTFAFAAIAVGHLDASTGFLFAIVVGNGINPGIVLLARTLDRAADRPLEGALAEAMRITAPVTLVASAAAAAAYGSLLVTSFRGLHNFGRIGSAGMLLCWLATTLFLPPTLLALERLGPLRPHRWAFALARPLSAIAPRFPRAVLAASALATLFAVAGTVRWLDAGPLEMDLRQIDNAPAATFSAAQRLAPVLDEVCGRQSQDGIALATDRLAQVRPLKAALEQRRTSPTAGAPPPFERVVTIFDLLPRAQPAKLALAEDTAALLRRARAKGFVDDEDWQRIEAQVPLEPQPVTIDDLPASLARPFVERDGTRGRLVYVVPTEGESIWDGRYLLRWAESIRRVELPDGSAIEGSGRSVIFADMLAALVEDAPRAVLASAAFTLLLLLASFRRSPRRGALVILSLVLGLTWTLGVIAVGRSSAEAIEGIRLSFLNVVALPITIGVGADYAVNVTGRLDAPRRVAGPVLLCSLTTTLGYGALVGSVNRAIASFGFIAAAGELCCLAAALGTLPALAALRSPGSGSR